MARDFRCSADTVAKTADGRMGARKTVILKNYYFAASV